MISQHADMSHTPVSLAVMDRFPSRARLCMYLDNSMVQPRLVQYLVAICSAVVPPK